jgi:2'-5' RNA ligase
VARLLFAVEVSREVSVALRSLQAKLEKTPAADALRFTDPDQAHYTLKFLGEESPERQVVAVRAARAAAGRARAFELTLQTLGVFPGDRHPHTIWIGGGRGAAELVELASLLEASLVREGFSAEDRPFVPHLTLARVKGRPPPGSIRHLLDDAVETVGSLNVESFSLMESRSTPSGVRYLRLETFRF